MTKLFLSIIFLLKVSLGFTQSVYQKGYILFTNGIKYDCLIKNEDRYLFSDVVTYKQDSVAPMQKCKISEINEFVINDYGKFVCADVEIDMSPAKISELTTHKKPLWESKILALNELVCGATSLYIYHIQDCDRFFYKLTDGKITQLVYKEFLSSDYKNVLQNKTYIFQLFRDVNRDQTSESISNVKYEAGALTEYFNNYNGNICKFEKKSNFESFNIKLRIAGNYTELKIKSLSFWQYDFNFSPTFFPGIDLEFEKFIHLRNNRFSVVFMPSFTYYDNRVRTSALQFQHFAKCKFAYIEFPLGFRYNYYLNKNSSLYVTGYLNYITNIDFNSYQMLPEPISIDFFKRGNFAIDMGYVYKKWSVNLRRYLNQDFTYSNWWSYNYAKTSLSVGYKLFQVNKRY
jgi:hypothetical protein